MTVTQMLGAGALLFTAGPVLTFVAGRLLFGLAMRFAAKLLMVGIGLGLLALLVWGPSTSHPSAHRSAQTPAAARPHR
jgi:hypothetical protein